jgi:hypothetical protein
VVERRTPSWRAIQGSRPESRKTAKCSVDTPTGAILRTVEKTKE